MFVYAVLHPVDDLIPQHYALLVFQLCLLGPAEAFQVLHFLLTLYINAADTILRGVKVPILFGEGLIHKGGCFTMVMGN